MGGFPQTRWTLILAAGAGSDEAAAQALADLCAAYWYPAYAFVRRMGNPAEDARDLTQEFFAGFLEKRAFERADREKGRFRSYLLTSLKHFLADEAERRRAAKRGGGMELAELDAREAEERYMARLADCETPERLYEREWAATLIRRVNDQVRQVFEREGRIAQFDRLKQFLPGNESGLPWARVARELGFTEGSLRVTIHRLRRRYRELFRSEIAQLVSDSADVDDEIRHLFHMLR